MRRFLLALALLPLLVAGVLPVPRAEAQQRGVVMERRDGVMTILSSGDVQITEVWQVRFEGGPYSNAFRSIPYTGVSGFKDWGVTGEGIDYQQDTSMMPGTFSLTEGDEARLDWYFPPATDEVRVFTLRYTAMQAIRTSTSGEDFRWTFIEADRQYPLERVNLVVILPNTMVPNEAFVFTYTDGVRSPVRRIADQSTVVFEGGPLAPGQSWGIHVLLPPDTIIE